MCVSVCVYVCVQVEMKTEGKNSRVYPNNFPQISSIPNHSGGCVCVCVSANTRGHAVLKAVLTAGPTHLHPSLTLSLSLCLPVSLSPMGVCHSPPCIDVTETLLLCTGFTRNT